ncbi:MAG: alpha/beta hydrolase [Clostridia bacterium]|nr:alpha/beta hydrolase [Clostridia bacterium]
MKIIENIFYTADRHPARMLDLYLPNGDTEAVFLYFHGGGLEHGDKRRASAFATELTDRSIAVVSANYRMYPDAAYPDFIEDAADAVAWAKSELNAYTSCKKLFVGGSSAGGYLSMMLCFDPRYLAAHGIHHATDITGYIHDAGQPTCHFNVLRERGIDSRRVIVDESAPLWHIGTAPAYAPMLFIVSDNDMQNRPEQTELTLSTLRHFGYDRDCINLIVAHGNHCAYVSRKEETGDSTFANMITPFIKKH